MRKVRRYYGVTTNQYEKLTLKYPHRVFEDLDLRLLLGERMHYFNWYNLMGGDYNGLWTKPVLKKHA